MNKLSIEERAHLLSEYNRLPHGTRKVWLQQNELKQHHIQSWTKQLDRHFNPGKTAAEPAKQLIEVSAEPGIEELLDRAIDHVEDALILIDKARYMNGNYGVVSARFSQSLVSADEGLTLVKLDLTMASLCNDFW